MAERIYKIIFDAAQVQEGVFTYINYVDPKEKLTPIQPQEVIDVIESRFTLDNLVIKDIKRIK